jgi:hypothetical protein
LQAGLNEAFGAPVSIRFGRSRCVTQRRFELNCERSLSDAGFLGLWFLTIHIVLYFTNA